MLKFRYAPILLCWATVAAAAAATAEKTCSAKASEKPLGGDALLMKDSTRSKRRASLVLNDESGQEGAAKYYGRHQAGRVLDHFMRWSDGAVESKQRRELMRELHVVTDPNLLLAETAVQSAARAASLLASAEYKQCQERAPPTRMWSLLDKTDSNGVEHVVLRSNNETKPKLQYIAVQHEQVIVADPPVACLMQQDPDLHADESDGGDQNLDLSDQLVRDCKKLFERTAMDLCKKELKLNILSASLQIIDGFEVNTEAEVEGQGGKKRHSPICLFEASGDHRDASLLQKSADPAETEDRKSVV